MTESVLAGYDQIIFDLDGVLILGDRPVPGAAEAVTKLSGQRVDAVFATNNASRSPGEVASLLTAVGIPATESRVFTSGRAAASLLAARISLGSPVLVVGSAALVEDVALAGLRPVGLASDAPVAVIQGYDAAVGWRILAEAVLAVRAGAIWVLTNGDRTLPSPRGPLPGNGALASVVSTALGRDPDVVVGKPAPELFLQAAKVTGARRSLVVGDRLDTDVEGAHRAEMDSLLVFTGVTRPADLLVAPPRWRPTFMAFDLEALSSDEWCPLEGEVDGWAVRRDGAVFALDGSGRPLDALRALCLAHWALVDIGQSGTAGPVSVSIVGESEPAKRALRQLGLA